MKRATLFMAAIAFAGAAPDAAKAANDEPFKISGADAVRGTTNVAIAAFNVGFIFESVDQTAATGGMIGAFGGTTKAKSELVGVTPEMMQSVADAAYADFAAQMAAKGFSLVAPSTIFADPAVIKAKPMMAPLEISIALEKGSKGKAVFLKPAALPSMLMMTGDFTGSGFSSMGLAMAAGQTNGALNQYARSSGATVVDVTYLIDFSNQKRPGAFSLSGIQVNAGLSVAASFSKVTLVAPSGKQSTLVVRQPVAVEGDFVEATDTTSGTGKATQAAANVAGGVAAAFGFGGLRFGKTRKFAFTAKPGNYEAGATKAATLANERVVNQLVALRQ